MLSDINKLVVAYKLMYEVTDVNSDDLDLSDAQVLLQKILVKRGVTFDEDGYIEEGV